MPKQRNQHLISKVLVLGGFIAVLVYFFHPGSEQFSLIINGKPVADPLTRFAAIPTLMIVMLFTSVLMFLAFVGVGVFMFITAISFAMFGIFFVAPYFWPVLAIISFIIIFMSINNNKSNP